MDQRAQAGEGHLPQDQPDPEGRPVPDPAGHAAAQVHQQRRYRAAAHQAGAPGDPYRACRQDRDRRCGLGYLDPARLAVDPPGRDPAPWAPRPRDRHPVQQGQHQAEVPRLEVLPEDQEARPGQ